jgi:fructokinase
MTDWIDRHREPIFCIGEVLWDIFPDRRFLGGAPFNVACQLAALGEPVRFASRVGSESLGEEIRREMKRRNLPMDLLQRDASLPTGQVFVDVADPQAPQYTIVAPAAWDAMQASDALRESASRARAIVFGTLAQRDERSRATIRGLLSPGPLRVLDINLRAPFDRREIVESSLELTDMLKLNDGELDRLASWFDLSGGFRGRVEALAARFQLDLICVTRGAEGAALHMRGEWHEHPGVKVKVADAVGAGDAFLAALLSGLLLNRPAADALAYANAVGAFVASQPSATPALDRAEINRLLIGAGH